MMEKIMSFKYLPGVMIFKCVRILFIGEYKHYISEYNRNNYLDPTNHHEQKDRMVVVQGQVGSTSGGEKRCSVWQS